MGLATWASMPAAAVAAMSSGNTLAVAAMRGTAAASSRFRARICLAAPQPSSTGICISSSTAWYQ